MVERHEGSRVGSRGFVGGGGYSLEHVDRDRVSEENGEDLGDRGWVRNRQWSRIAVALAADVTDPVLVGSLPKIADR